MSIHATVHCRPLLPPRAPWLLGPTNHTAEQGTLYTALKPQTRRGPAQGLLAAVLRALYMFRVSTQDHRPPAAALPLLAPLGLGAAVGGAMAATEADSGSPAVPPAERHLPSSVVSALRASGIRASGGGVAACWTADSNQSLMGACT